MPILSIVFSWTLFNPHHKAQFICTQNFRYHDEIRPRSTACSVSDVDGPQFLTSSFRYYNSTADFENKRRLTPSDAYRATHQCVLGDQCRGDSRWPDNFHRHIDWFTWTLYKEQYAADPDDNIVTPQRPASLLQIPQSFDAFPYRIPEGHGDGRAQGFW